jgi:hypothetical protein
LDAYKQGHYQTALRKLNRAYAVMKAPTLGLWTARAMVRVGLLVEAAARYLETTQLPAAAGDLELQQEARTVAAEERKALLPRIPHLTVLVVGVPAGGVEVQLDGERLASTRLGGRMPVNPGAREVVGRAGTRVVTQRLTLAEGEDKRVTLDLTPPGTTLRPPSIPALPATARPGASAPASSPSDSDSSSVGLDGLGPSPAVDGAPDSDSQTGSLQRALGWTVFGIGGGGIAVGGIAGAMLLAKQSELDSSEDCADHACGPAKHDDVDQLNALRRISGAALAIGGVGLAAGLTLVLTAPSATDTASPRVSPWVGLGAVGAVGEF